MFIDATELADGAAIETDLCIVGAGLAGLAVASRFERTDTRVVLLESGAVGVSSEADDLSAGETTAHPYFDFTEAAPRRFGGAAETWGAWSRPIDRLDMEERPWSDSGWPVDLEEMDRYFGAACEFLRLVDCGFDGRAWADGLPPLYRHIQDETSLEVGIWQESPLAPISEHLAEPLRRSANVSVYLGATALDIQFGSDDETVIGLEAGTPNGKRFTVRARQFVLAGGALGTVRLLLASDDRHKAGVGNQHDLVGRYFAEHPHIVGGRMTIRRSNRPRFPAIDRGLLGAMARVEMERPSAGIRAGISLSEEVRRHEGLPNVIAHLRPPSVEPPRCALIFFREVRHRNIKKTIKAVPGLLRNIPQVLNVVYRRLLRRPQELELYVQVETVPNRESRIVLAEAKDAFGMPRAEMQWRLQPIDKEKLARTLQLMGDELEQLGLGHLRLEPWVTDPSDVWSDRPFGGLHLMGTTRMSESAESGVVDPQCRVHGYTNLWVAGSSVFPTYGAANPGLTIVATALRTGDHLAAAMGAS